LEALVAAQVVESETIEYKHAPIDVKTEDGKLEFLKDVSSFLNGSGGDIICGMAEKNGVPTKILPVQNFDFERGIVTLRDIWLHHLDPSPVTVRARKVAVPKVGGSILLIRIDQSWNGPHMVTFGGDNRFYVRDHGGKRVMNAIELRRAFNLSASINKRMRLFIDDRRFELKNRGVATCMMHVLPLVSFASRFSVDLEKAVAFDGFKTVPFDGQLRTFNFDGVVAVANHRVTGQRVSHLQLFRNGNLEFCALMPKPARVGLQSLHLFHQMAETALKIYGELNVPPPFIFFLSYTAFSMASLFAKDGMTIIARSDRDDVVLPDVVASQLDADPQALLQPAYDVLYQIFGQPRAPAIFGEKSS
jgi:hypothetical protein